MNDPDLLPSAIDRFAAAAFGALVGSAVASVMLGGLIVLPIAMVIGCLMALPSVLLLTGFTEAAARLAPALHASFPIWLGSGLVATAPVGWMLTDSHYYLATNSGVVTAAIAGLTATIAAWGFYIRKAQSA